MRKIIVVVFALTILGIIIYTYSQSTINETVPGARENQFEELEQNNESDDIEVIVENLSVPWGIVFLPDGDLLVTERSGRLVRIGNNSQIIEVNGVSAQGEGGLLGIALHPQYEENSLLYLYMTKEDGSGLINQVERYKLENNELVNREVILANIPGARNHDGGRIAFGPDGYLYIATGDAGNPSSAQDTNSLAGKILRVSVDGDIPSDNPFGNAVYSYGHRNVQGITWDDQGQLWATEHGRSGLLSGLDEINLIEIGNNYGWPEVEGDETGEGYIAPALHSGASETWAPGGIAYVNGSLVFVGLRGETVYVTSVSGIEVGEIERHLVNDYGRLRTVKVSPDNQLYILTSNRDGRGSPTTSDDLIIRLSPHLLGL
ncbi:MAG: PQQ-dependent sugar dehydrogenase [Candidatus Paceibacteria bacterium]